MSTHTLNIFIEKMNNEKSTGFIAWQRNCQILRTILVLSRAHECAHASASRHLNMSKQQGELRSKCSEMEKGGRETFWVAVSCENSTLLALFIFSTKMLKMCLWHSVVKILFQIIATLKQPVAHHIITLWTCPMPSLRSNNIESGLMQVFVCFRTLGAECKTRHLLAAPIPFCSILHHKNLVLSLFIR